MSIRHRFLLLSTALTLLLCACVAARADATRDFGTHVVHYKAMPTSALDSAVAAQLRINRHSGRGVLNIAIVEKSTEDAIGQSTQGRVTVHWSDLKGKMGAIPVREIHDRHATYYIGEFDLSDTAMMTFDVLISVHQNRLPYSFSFKQQFTPN